MSPDLYLDRHARYGPLIINTSPSSPQMVITIPAYHEKGLVDTLHSLTHCNTTVPCAVFVLINYSESEDPSNHQAQFDETMDWITKNQQPNLTFSLLQMALPAKTAGVGLARKILMDEAVRHAPEVIVCLDADCTVQSNYLDEIWKFFQFDISGASIHFEHPFDGEYADAITAYELHLRYYVEAQRWLGVPYAFHTVGSSMAVRTSDYCKTGGMNVRKAGEDFYFLQKIIPRGFGSLTSTTVYPSDRTSERVPFGTGKAIGVYQEKMEQYTYAPEALNKVKNWLDRCLRSWDQPDTTGLSPGFISDAEFEHEWHRIARNSTSHDIWKRHFFAWFDGFKLMKMLHYLRDNGYPNVPVLDASHWLLAQYGLSAGHDMKDTLHQFRELEKSYSSNRLSR